jgi:hypothetical protein
MQRTLPEVETLIARLPINDTNFPVFEALLRLNFDVYRPILDMLFDGTITPEDLVTPSSSAAALAADNTTLAGARYHGPWSQVDPAAVSARCLALLSGKRPSQVVLPRDSSAVAISPTGAPASDGTFAPSAPLVASMDPMAVAPNPVEVARAGSVEAAAKAVQETLTATLRPQVS